MVGSDGPKASGPREDPAHLKALRKSVAWPWAQPPWTLDKVAEEKGLTDTRIHPQSMDARDSTRGVPSDDRCDCLWKKARVFPKIFQPAPHNRYLKKEMRPQGPRPALWDGQKAQSIRPEALDVSHQDPGKMRNRTFSAFKCQGRRAQKGATRSSPIVGT